MGWVHIYELGYLLAHKLGLPQLQPRAAWFELKQTVNISVVKNKGIEQLSVHVTSSFSNSSSSINLCVKTFGVGAA